MEYIISFKNTNHAVKAEQCLLSRGMAVGVLPLPTQIRAGCGLCLRVDEHDIADAVAELAENDIVEIGLFSREEQDGRYAYTEITDERAE